jgi:endonuclease-3
VQTERDLKKLFPEKDWGRVHLQMIYFGREHCPALRHDFGACPICSWAAPMRRRTTRASRPAAPTGRSGTSTPRRR